MPKRFYVAWALAVILALVLPVAIPYFIWPPDDYKGGSFDGPARPSLFGGYALLARYVPTSVSVESAPRPEGVSASGCSSNRALRSLESGSAPKVTLRGAYGFPLGSFDESCLAENGLLFSTGIGLLLAGLAWLAGIVAVSAPFLLVLKRRLAARPESPPILRRPVPG